MFVFEKNVEKRNKIVKFFAAVLLVIFLVSGGFFGGLYLSAKNEVVKQLASKEVVYVGKLLKAYSDAPAGKISRDVDFDLFWQVWDMLKTKYVGKNALTDKQMFYGALRGLVASAGDPYTVFMDPQISQEFSDDLSGTFEGIGAELGMKKDVLTIIAPLDDMPAQKAGLRSGDKIVAINGESSSNLTVDEAVSKIRGPKGTVVKLTIFREGEEAPRDVEITRGTITVKSVNVSFRDDGICVIKISNFNSDTDGLFEKAVIDILNKNPKGIILDLRNDPGGYLETAINIASKWIDKGVIVSEKFSDEKKTDHMAKGSARLKDFRTVVLVNEGSASASEILSGALHDYGKAKLVGKKTYGKGSVQELEDLKDGSSVKVTVAEWLTPKGTNINHEGIMPDYVVDLTAEEYNNNKDPQMDKAIEILESGENQK